ncbi:hypothetical protein QQ045_021047 [Rhodiola kirilowii]
MAQRIKETEITEQDSLLLTRNLLRIAIFNISYIRGLFPEKYFSDKSVPALEMKIKKLMPIDVESRRLIDWMEKGVYDALQKKYLKTLLFCICETVEGPMMEEYAFSFSYSNNDSQEVSMDINRTGDKKGGSFKYNSMIDVTPNQMRSSACKMIRTLVQLVRTLDRMPEERTILMKLLYYDDVTPIDYEPPFFRGCTEEESHNSWTKNPLRMDVGNVNSKHFVFALKVKSVLDLCEDENDEIEDGDVSLGDDSCHEDEYTDTDTEVKSSVRIDKFNSLMIYITKPVSITGMLFSYLATTGLWVGLILMHKYIRFPDDTSHPTEDMEEFQRIKDWIMSSHNDNVELTDVLSNFPHISVVISEKTRIPNDFCFLLLVPKSIMIFDLFSFSGFNRSRIEPETVRSQGPWDFFFKWQNLLPQICSRQCSSFLLQALYHALPMNYVTVGKLQNKLEANQGTVRKLIDKMTREGYLQATSNKRLGKRVIKSSLTEKKLMEIKKALDNQSLVNTYGLTVSKNQKDISTFGGVYSIGSDITRTIGIAGHVPIGPAISDQTITNVHGNSPTSRAQPADSRESAVPLPENKKAAASTTHHEEADKVICSSRSTQDKRPRKESMVKEPILQFVKRQKSAL